MGFIYSSGEITGTDTGVQCINLLKPFAEENGWTTDNFSGGRFHMHKGLMHVDFLASGTSIKMFGCTGYSGAANDAQPGTSSQKNWAFASGKKLILISTNNALYIGLVGAGLIWWGILYHNVPNKVGVWSGGFGISAPGPSPFTTGFYSYPCYHQIYCNNNWSGYSVLSGSCSGTIGNYTLASESFGLYNGGIMPIPVMMYIVNSVDTTKFHPIGFFPELYSGNGGSLYGIGEIITIGEDSYVIYPLYSWSIGNTSVCDLIFKLGS